MLETKAKSWATRKSNIVELQCLWEMRLQAKETRHAVSLLKTRE